MPWECTYARIAMGDSFFVRRICNFASKFFFVFTLLLSHVYIGRDLGGGGTPNAHSRGVNWHIVWRLSV